MGSVFCRLGVREVALSVLLGVGATAATNPSPTFYKDVLPVLQRNCQNCHRPGEAAPMSFLDYGSTGPWPRRSSPRFR